MFVITKWLNSLFCFTRDAANWSFSFETSFLVGPLWRASNFLLHFFFISSGGCCRWSNGKLRCLFVSSFWLIVVSSIVGLFGRHVAFCCWIILLLNLSWPKWSSLGRLNCGHDKLNLNRHFIHERSGIWLEQESSKNRIEWSTNWDSVFIYFIHERDVWNPLRLSFGWCLMRQKNCLTTSD